MDSLVSTQWLANALGAADLIVLDTSKHLPAANRDAVAEFEQAHIPGARFFDQGALVDTASPVPQSHPRPEQLASVLSDCGITAETRIVLYDDSAVKSAARAWFLLQAHGLTRVAILDGGLAKWRSEGRDLAQGASQMEPEEMLSLETPTRIWYKKRMIANIESSESQVLDARDEGRFSGRVSDDVHNLASGHIPGSCNLPFSKLFAEDGTYRPFEELRAAIREAGIAAGKPVTTTCGSGMTASVLLFALHLTGRNDTALYDGSWLDWGSDPSTPKAVLD